MLGNYLFFWQGLGPVIHLKESVNANQCKVLMTDHPIMGVVSSKMTPPPSSVHNGSWDGFIRMKIFHSHTHCFEPNRTRTVCEILER